MMHSTGNNARVRPCQGPEMLTMELCSVYHCWVSIRMSRISHFASVTTEGTKEFPSHIVLIPTPKANTVGRKSAHSNTSVPIVRREHTPCTPVSAKVGIEVTDHPLLTPIIVSWQDACKGPLMLSISFRRLLKVSTLATLAVIMLKPPEIFGWLKKVKTYFRCC